MEKKIQSKKIVWAVDPFAEDKNQESELLTSVAWAVRTLAAGLGAEVEPVYIINEAPLGLSTALPPEILRQTEESGQDAFDCALTRVTIKNLLPLKVIPGVYPGQGDLTQALISYAKQVKAELIVLGTHARKGLDRLFVGSFAEAMVLRSDVPFFVVNPHWKSTTDFKNILFPTDFSDESLRAFGRVVELAKTLKADLTIYHQLLSPASAGVASSANTIPTYGDAYEKALKGVQKRIGRLAGQAGEQGVVVHSFIEYKSQSSVADSILSFAQGKHYIIAMAARSGGISAALLGSTTRRVVRESNYPVWVVHPNKTTKSTKKSERVHSKEKRTTATDPTRSGDLGGRGLLV